MVTSVSPPPDTLKPDNLRGGLRTAAHDIVQARGRVRQGPPDHAARVLRVRARGGNTF